MRLDFFLFWIVFLRLCVERKGCYPAFQVQKQKNHQTMSKERQQLIKDKRERNEDREEMARRVHQSRVGGRKRDASQLSKRVADDHSRTVAAQFQCIDAGYRLVSQPQTFQPKLEKFDTLPNFPGLRSQTELEPRS